MYCSFDCMIQDRFSCPIHLATQEPGSPQPKFLQLQSKFPQSSRVFEGILLRSPVLRRWEMSAIVSRSPRSVLPPLMALHSQKVTFCLGILRSLHYPALRLLRYPTAASEKTHTMGSSLSEYLRLKVHPDIADRDWSRILVRGQHQRDPSLANTSNIEKNDKTFNWQRPTTSLIDEKTLQLQCFPGIDYVRHYAAITATYLSLKGRRHDHVQYTLPSPAECLEPLMSSNLSKLGPVDVVVVGHVPGLGRWTYGQWEAADSNELFSWKTFMSRRGYRVAFLGCRISFWGDIAGNLVRTLRTLNGARCVLFVGKLGGLNPITHPTTGLQREMKACCKAR